MHDGDQPICVSQLDSVGAGSVGQLCELVKAPPPALIEDEAALRRECSKDTRAKGQGARCTTASTARSRNEAEVVVACSKRASPCMRQGRCA